MESITDGPLAGGQPRAPYSDSHSHEKAPLPEEGQGRSTRASLSRALGVARDRDFTRLWAAESISAVGSQVTAVAMPLLAALTLEASPMAVGVLTAATGLPHLLFGLFAGAWVDRLRRRPIMVASDVGRAALLAIIPLAAWFDLLRIELLIVVAYLAYVPALVSREKLVEANSKLEASSSGAQVIGPALGGFLVRVLGAPIAILVDAFSFLGSAALLFGIRVQEPPPAPVEDSNLLGEVTQGLRVLWHNRILRALALASAVMNFAAFFFFAVYVLYLTRTLGLGPGAVGLVFAVGGVGALIGSLAAGRIRARWGIGATLVGSLLLFGVFGLTIPLAVLFPRYALPLILASELLQWVMVIIFDINAVSLRQTITPDRLLGRVSGSIRFVVWGVRPLGSLLGGYLGSRIGLPATLAIGGLGMLLSFAPLLASPIPRLREIDGGAE